jgi:D-amino-acid dehydrogenase
VGLSTAYYARAKGHDVDVLDSGDGSSGCSFGNSGLVVPSHFVPLASPGTVGLGLRYMWSPESPFYIKPRLDRDLLSWLLRFWWVASAKHVRRSEPLLRDLHLRSRECYVEWANHFADFGLARKGLLMLCATEEGLGEEGASAAEARNLGIPAEVLTPARVRQLEPDLPLAIKGGVFYPLDCHLDPPAFMAVLRAEVERMGVRLLWNTEVSGFERNRGRIIGVRTPGELHTADAFVLAAGVWSQALARGLGLSLPLQPGKGYSLTLPKPPKLPVHPSILVEGRVAVTPIGSTLRFGGTMELGAFDPTINPSRIRGIIRSVTTYFPGMSPRDFDGVPPWCGLRPCSPDGLPYIGPFKRHPNLFAATGHAMMGVSLGPITGRLVAEMLSREAPSVPVAALSPDRFA